MIRDRAGWTDPDVSCLTAVRNGDGSGLDELMRRHGEALHRFIFRYTYNAQDAADLTQETFLRVFRKAASYMPTARVKTWIYTIALNLCRDRARRAKHIKWIPFLSTQRTENSRCGLEDTLPDDRPDPGDSTSQLELATAITEAIATLPEKLRAPFALCVLDDLPHAAAGEILKLSAKSVEVRIYRARQRLREVLRPFLNDLELS
ncbi:MAG: RNA polymerase sigma factor [Verrucomicrobia bacterium]|nr:RNA polymerase sigma factor [Verrucomicrobiota bacterium]MDA1007094.1 RNA polymerase sigma factor [Verrucomicrobiota bacterium]